MNIIREQPESGWEKTRLDGRIPELYWESTYAISVALIEDYPERNPEDVGLMELADLVVTLPGFNDDPAMVTERILLDILNVWYEEASDQ